MLNATLHVNSNYCTNFGKTLFLLYLKSSFQKGPKFACVVEIELLVEYDRVTKTALF